MKPSIVFFGNERLATGLEDTKPLVLQGLLECGYHIEAVITRHTPAQSRKNRPLEIEELADKHNVPVLKPTSREDLVRMTHAHPADIGVLAAFGMIVPREVIDAFPHGIINLHPSLLPRYRGTTPIEQAMLDGAAETGASVMQVDDRMDAGPVLAQDSYALTGSELKADLAQALQKLGARLVIDQVERVVAGTVQLRSQDESAATFCARLTKADGVIDWLKPAERLEREVRAYLGWPGSRTTLLGREVTVTQARIADKSIRSSAKPGDHSVVDGEIQVQTGDGILAIQRLKPAGKHEMAAGDFARGQHPTL